MRRLRKLLRLARRSGYRRALLRGVPAAIEHEGALRSLRLAGLVDVGANVGQFSALARALHPGLQIHAFEPLDEPARRFQRLFGQDAAAHLHRCAAGEAPGEALIHVSARPDSSSLLPISQRQSELFPGTEEVAVRSIGVVRADDVIDAAGLPQPLLVKLDVQGFELAALKGMPAILARADYVYAEVSFLPLYEGQPLADEVIAWLSERSFRLAGMYNMSYASSGEAVQGDALFRRAD